jgi:hypothetical protein
VDNPQAAHSHCIVARLCCRMSSDPLPLPEIWSDLPKGDTYESTRTEFVANGRSGLVLIEYASGFTQSDPRPVGLPIEPAEQPVASERVPSLAPAALAKGLADLTAIVTQAEALLRAQGTLKGDVHFAVVTMSPWRCACATSSPRSAIRSRLPCAKSATRWCGTRRRRPAH